PPSKINLIETDGNPPLLRLTVVIEDDLRIPAVAKKRVASPTKFTRWRSADARDAFQYTSIDPGSANYPEDGDGDPLVIRDDTIPANNHARALRSAHEMPPLAGSVTLPGIITYYEIGDRINYIAGRDIKLYQNAASEQGETPTHPVIVSRSWSFD